ncbi:MAG: toll/interleukin-1 receptor domain-containing protein [Eubacteriales bacterium]|nr:toll/interleukin-1 receptor domain-containing protein [Eubacteriales bacterium]
MIFIGYSNRDRYDIVEPMIFHLKNYGINVWYDFHDMFLSDNRFHENFELGIGKSRYVIFIISHNFFDSNCAVEELKYAQMLYEKGEIVLFPVLYLLKASDLPNDYSWIKKIIYNEVNEHSGTLFVTNQIIEKMLHDESKLLPFRSFPEVV